MCGCWVDERLWDMDRIASFFALVSRNLFALSMIPIYVAFSKKKIRIDDL